MGTKINNSLFVNNLKAYGIPREFINLARRNALPSFVYLILMTILTTILCFVIPFNGELNEIKEVVVTGADKYLPEFEFTKGELKVADNKEFDLMKENNLNYDDIMVIANTSVDYFQMTGDKKDSITNYMTDAQIDKFSTGQGAAVFLAKKNFVTISRGQVQMFNYSQFLQNTNINVVRIDKAEFIAKIPTWWTTCELAIGAGVVVLMIINLFFMSLIYTFVAKIVDSIVRCHVPFGKMYRAVMFIYMPWRAIMLLVTTLLPGFAGVSTFISFVFMLTYIILTLVSFGKKEGMYSEKIKEAVFIQPDSDELVLVPGIKSQFDDNFSSKPFMPSDYEIEHAAEFTGAPNEYRANAEDHDRVKRSEEEEWQDLATDYAQNDEYASKSLVWKPQMNADGEMEQAETSQQWRPQATETDEEYRARKKDWERYNKVWGKDNIKK